MANGLAGMEESAVPRRRPPRPGIEIGPPLTTVMRKEWPLLLAIVLLPFLLALPGLLHLVAANPAVALEGITKGYRPGLLPGFAYIDPNVGFTTQALGRLDTVDLLHGTMPWWNPYSGTGMPLAAEFQSAPFLPFTWLLALPGSLGIPLEHAALQATAGIGTYLLLRKLGLSRSLSWTGGALFAVNGTFAWFASNPTVTLTFLPWLILGTEVAVQRTALGRAHRWEAVAATTTFLILAGFPETAYVGLLLAAVWGLVRASELRARQSWRALVSICTGLLAGAFLSAFFLVPFVEALPYEDIAGHSGGFGNAFLPPASVLQGLLAPYVAGPIFAVPPSPRLQVLNISWAMVGGYVTPVLLLLALYGLVTRLDRLSIALTAFALVCIGRTYGVEPFLQLFNLLPGATRVAAFRYANPAWELALLVVALRGLSGPSGGAPRHRVALGTTILGLCGLVALAVSQSSVLAALFDDAQSAPWALWSLIVAAVTALATVAGLSVIPWPARRTVLAGLFLANALVLFVIPILSNPRAGTPDSRLLRYLHATLGDYRVFSLGILAPNYSASDRLASLDFNYLPVPSDLASWIDHHVEPGFSTSPVVLDGVDLPESTSLTWPATLALSLRSYEALGVRDIVVAAGIDPLTTTLTLPGAVGTTDVQLRPGEQLRGELPDLSASTATITSVSVEVPSPSPSTGTLTATLCDASRCARGTTSPVASTTSVPLDRPVAVTGSGPLRFVLTWAHASSPLELAAAPASGFTYRVTTTSGEQPSVEPILSFGLSIAGQAHEIYHDTVATVYRLNVSDPIFSTPTRGCTIRRATVETADLSCVRPGVLVYRETAFPGWSASTGATSLPIRRYEGLFQSVRVPSGNHTVAFRYVPPHEGLFELTSGTAAAAFAVDIAAPPLARRRRRRTR